MSAETPAKIDWYRTPLPRETLKKLNERSDLLGGLQTVGFLALLATTGGGTLWAWFAGAPWYVVLALLLAHGTGSSFYINGVHELCHYTVFKTRKLNEFFMPILAFFGWNNHIQFTASHANHHRHTLHPPDDLEVVLPIRISLAGFLKSAFVNPWGLWFHLKGAWRLACGHVDGEWNQKLFPPDDTQGRARLRAWGWTLLLGHGGIAVFSLAQGWWLVPVVVSLAPFYGGWLHFLVNNTQHVGLQDKVPDFRLCCRSFKTRNPLISFLYWHMQYHTEHHMYAAVPCYRLRALHRAIAHDLAEPKDLVGTWREIAEILKRQETEPDYQFIREVPNPRLHPDRPVDGDAGRAQPQVA